MTTALYRRYRPDTFDDVIGQEHVTDALKTALSTSRVAHAFLFSGPRGCGKTTSARILARSLNCEKGPTPTPCGECPSCRDLAAGGPGSLDVVEIDAASHNTVDDARELRDRVTFAPTRDRYRIFILDEAHMVTDAGFNALLKVVEEPPEHVKFIFATTEPDKVISTIKSRTHHYPFRLVGPNALKPLLERLAEKEGMDVDKGVYPLLIRAGGGSVRDSLSAMDQLMAGADGHVTTDAAVRLLGYTDSSLLDRTVEALGDRDGAKVFAIVEEIIEAGHEPRQFTMDLLQRLRDMMVCALAGERAADILVEMPSDVLQLMQIEAQKWGPLVLSSAADRVESALREMTVASAPRMQLELLLARLLVDEGAAARGPSPAASPTGAIPRASGPTTVPSPTSGPAAGAHHRGPGVPAPRGVPADSSRMPAVRPRTEPPAAEAPAPKSQVPESSIHEPAETPAAHPTSADRVPESEVQSPAPQPPATVPAPQPPAAVDVGQPGTAPTKDQVRGKWTALLEEVGKYGGLYAPLLQSDVRDVVSRGSVVHFFLLNETNAERIRARGGEEHLGQALSALFGGTIQSQVHAWSDLETFNQSQPAEAEDRKPAPSASTDAESVSPADTKPATPADAAAARPSDAKPPAAAETGASSPADAAPPSPSPAEPASTQESEEAATSRIQDRTPDNTAEGAERPSPQTDAADRAGDSQNAQASTAPDVAVSPAPAAKPDQPAGSPPPAQSSQTPPNVWRGRPAVDVVLGVLGGQVVEEEIVSTDQ